MAKYSYEFKKQVVDAYLRGEGGYTYILLKNMVSKIGVKSLTRYIIMSSLAIQDC